MTNKIRTGIFIDSDKIPAWMYQMLTEIYNSDYADLKLIIQNDSQKSKSGILKKLFNKNDLFYSIFLYIERKLFRLKEDAFELKSINDFNKVSIIKIIHSQNNNYIHSFNDTLDEVKKYDLDVLLKLGSAVLKGDILKIPKYGVWTYQHNNIQLNQGVFPGFWEVMRKCPETSSSLNMLSKKDEIGKILFSSSGMTDPHSVIRNMNTYYWKSARFIPRKLKELFLLGEDYFFRNIFKSNQHPSIYSNKPLKIPNNVEMLFLIGRHLLRYLKEKFNEFLYFEQWQLQYAINRENKPPESFIHFNKIIPPKDRFWADPDFIKKESKYYIFFEELIYAKKKAHISMIEMDGNGNLSAPKIILRKDYHLSFPFVFQTDNRYYLIPETSGNKTIELYKCVDFPGEWSLQSILMNDVIAADSNIFFHNGKWWLFTNIKENEGISLYDELFLFFSNDFQSNKWTPHPQNPIISDVKSARPAGHIFRYNNNLYRPSQNSLGRYGYGMKINQIITLNENEYEEKVIDQIKPNWGKNYLGTHTLNYKEDLTMIDVLVKRRRFFN